jgi:CcmD family protein
VSPSDSASSNADAPSAAALTSPDDRATTFQAVKGEPEHYNGETLLVTAYAAIWVILLVWVALVWRKQAGLGTRLEELERVLGEAARKQPK